MHSIVTIVKKLKQNMKFIPFDHWITHFPLPAISGNPKSIICIYEPGVLLDSTYKWDLTVFVSDLSDLFHLG